MPNTTNLNKPLISVSIVTYNADRYLTQCLKSLAWVDEIVLIDLGSNDQTLNIAAEFGCKIFHKDLVPVVEKVRMEAIAECKGDWILVIDPDEYVPPELAERLQKIVADNQFDAVSIPRKNMMFGQWIRHSGWQSDRHTRFFRRGHVHYLPHVHEPEVVTGRVLDLPDTEGNYIVHYNYDTITQFIQKLDRYTSAEVEKSNDSVIVEESIRSSLHQFAERYYWLEGWKDGLQGVALCQLMAFYRFTIDFKRLEKAQWRSQQDDSLNTLLLKTNHSLLLGMRDLVTGMEHTANTIKSRLIYRILRKGLSLAIRLQK